MVGISSCRLAKRKAEMLVSPKFHVSRTRLIIYNLPKTMTINDVKKLCREAVISRATKQNPVIRKVRLGVYYPSFSLIYRYIFEAYAYAFVLSR
jgi:hypothetical protein